MAIAASLGDGGEAWKEAVVGLVATLTHAVGLGAGSSQVSRGSHKERRRLAAARTAPEQRCGVAALRLTSARGLLRSRRVCLRHRRCVHARTLVCVGVRACGCVGASL